MIPAQMKPLEMEFDCDNGLSAMILLIYTILKTFYVPDWQHFNDASRHSEIDESRDPTFTLVDHGQGLEQDAADVSDSVSVNQGKRKRKQIQLVTGPLVIFFIGFQFRLIQMLRLQKETLRPRSRRGSGRTLARLLLTWNMKSIKSACKYLPSNCGLLRFRRNRNSSS